MRGMGAALGDVLEVWGSRQQGLGVGESPRLEGEVPPMGATARGHRGWEVAGPPCMPEGCWGWDRL